MSKRISNKGIIANALKLLKFTIQHETIKLFALDLLLESLQQLQKNRKHVTPSPSNRQTYFLLVLETRRSIENFSMTLTKLTLTI